MEVNTYIGVWTLKVKCTQSGLHGPAAFKNARAILFFKVRGSGLHLGSEGGLLGARPSPGQM